MDQLRILVVDDDADCAESLVEVLGALGHEGRAAGDAETAIALASRFLPHLAVLDIGLPRMDGYQLAARLLAMPGLHQLKLIALTGFGQPTEFKRAPFSGYLVKPAGVEELEAAIRTCVDR